MAAAVKRLNIEMARLPLQDAAVDALERSGWYTQAELAARLGIVPAMVQHALLILESDGFIAVDRHQIYILSRQALAEIAL